MNLNIRLNSMLSDLADHKRSRADLRLYYLQKRLNTSFDNYQDDLDKCINYLINRKELNLAKKMNRNL